jgi:hypothetical protein
MIFYAIVDIVPVGTEFPIEEQDQPFEEEELDFLGDEGKWISSPAYSILTHTTCIITKIYF